MNRRLLALVLLALALVGAGVWWSRPRSGGNPQAWPFASVPAFKGDQEQAIQRLEAHLQQFGGHAAAYVALGICQRNLSRPEAALAAFDRALDLEAELAVGFRERGALLHELGRFQEARADYEAAVRCEPSHPAGYVGWGRALAALGRHEEALRAYDQAKAALEEGTSWERDTGYSLHLARSASEAALEGRPAPPAFLGAKEEVVATGTVDDPADPGTPPEADLRRVEARCIDGRLHLAFTTEAAEATVEGRPWEEGRVLHVDFAPVGGRRVHVGVFDSEYHVELGYEGRYDSPYELEGGPLALEGRTWSLSLGWSRAFGDAQEVWLRVRHQRPGLDRAPDNGWLRVPRS